jgi:simple sugar transport system permease protein
MNVEVVLTALVAAAIAGSVPLMLAAVGEAIGERAGLLNLGIEGVLMVSGLVAFSLVLHSGSLVLGLTGGGGAGLLCGLGFGLLATRARADQAVLGLGMTMAGLGGTAFIFREVWGSQQPLLAVTSWRPLEGHLTWVPMVGPALGQQRWPVFAAWLLVIAMATVMRRSKVGLQMRAAGEYPLGLEASGASVDGIRITAAVLAGTLTGFGGAYLTTVELGLFSPGVSVGTGFMAVAVAMLGQRNPLRVALYSLGFGLLTGLDTALQLAGVGARPEFLRMIPYIAIVVTMVLQGRDRTSPAALGQAYRGLAGRR